MLKKVWSFSGVRFIFVGIINTIIDFLILNVLVFAFGLNNIVANSVSVTIAMLISYLLNHTIVFRYEGKNHAKNLILFVLITAFGLFVLQNLVIYTLVHLFMWPADTATSIIHWLGFNNMSKEFVSLNFAKATATGVTMVWNYFMYKRFVFNQKTP